MNVKEIDDYLLNGMSENERQKLEDELIANNDLFAEIAERENELVDLYASGKLTGDDLERFERSVAANPARRQKIENAKVLREFVAGERKENRTITIAERTGFFAKLGEIFSFGSPAFQFASIGLILLLGLATVWLLVERSNTGTSSQAALQHAREREAELLARLENEQEGSAELAMELNAERDRIDKLEAEVERLRQAGPVNKPERPAAIVATLLLMPASIRGGSAPAKQLVIPNGATRVAISIGLPPERSDVERVSVKLNGEAIASSVRVRSRDGQRLVSTTIPVSKFVPGRNEVTLVSADGSIVAAYPVARTEVR